MATTENPSAGTERTEPATHLHHRAAIEYTQINNAIASGVAHNVDDFMTLVTEADEANERERDSKHPFEFIVAQSRLEVSVQNTPQEDHMLSCWLNEEIVPDSIRYSETLNCLQDLPKGNYVECHPVFLSDYGGL